MADDRLVAEIALRLGYLQREQLGRCLQAKRAEGGTEHLAEVAERLGLLTREQVTLVRHHEQRILDRRRPGAASPAGPRATHAHPAAPASPARAPPPDGSIALDPQPEPSGLELADPEPAIATAPSPEEREIPSSIDLENSDPEAPAVQTNTARSGPSLAPATRASLVPALPAGHSHRRRGPPRAVVARQRLADPALEEQTSGEVPYLLRALKFSVDKRASDLHVHSGAPLMARAHGRLVPFRGTPVLDRQATEKVVAQLLDDEQWGILEAEGEVDLAIQVRGLGRFRCNAYRQHRGVDMVMRIIPPQAPTLDGLGLPDTLARLVDFRTGLVLCTGPTGCGKSTTLAALVNAIVRSRKDHVVTIENPVEYVFADGTSKVTQRQVGAHTESFPRALRAALREDPDVIAITELRDRETISLALTAAETGHLVLGTLHTSNAAQTIGRVINAFAADEQPQIRTMFAESLRAVISQRLVPRADGPGRIPAVEVLIVNTAVTNLIREGREFQLASLMQTGKGEGMRTLDDSLLDLLKQGSIDKTQAARFAENKERFR